MDMRDYIRECIPKLAKKLAEEDPKKWESTVREMKKIIPDKIGNVLGLLSIDGKRHIRLRVLETSCLPRNFLIRLRFDDEDPDIRERARAVLEGRRKQMFVINQEG